MDIKKRRKCPLNPANSFINVKTARICSPQKKGTVVCFVHMVQLLVHQFRAIQSNVNLIQEIWGLPNIVY